jgi:hypothetical protein
MISPTFFRNKLLIGIVFIVGNALSVNAAVIDDITQDFEPISGYVVMSDGGEFIIDLDDTQGIAPGDIFSVISPGKKIVHPVTKKVLGTLEEVKGVLKVTRTKLGFSFARPVGNATDIKSGDPIRRYGNLPALFWDYTGKGLPLFIQLQKALTDLKWVDYNSAQNSRPPKPVANSENRESLAFILTDSGLEVRDPEFVVIRSYDYPASLSKAAPSPSTTTKAAAASAPVVAATRPKTEGSMKTLLPTRRETTGVKSVSPLFSEVQTVANLPGVSLTTDFLNHGGQLLMASSNGEQIQIFDVTDKLKVIADGAPSYPVRILSLKWWTPAKDDSLYLAANVWSDRDKKVRGTLFRLDKGFLRPVIQEIPRILGTFDFDSDGRPEVLLGQEFEGETFFGRRLNELKLSGDKEIDYGKPHIQLPRHFTVLGSVFADVSGNGQMETIYVRNRILYVYSGTKRLYKSPKQMGGSLSFLTYDIDPTFKDVQTTTVEFEISPVVKDLDGDGHPEILAVASDRDLLGSLSISTGVKKSWLAVFKYQDGRFDSGSLGNELDKPLQGLAVEQHRVWVVATEPGNLLGEGANSHLLAYSLSQ